VARQALAPLGISPEQAEVARLVHRGYRNEQIAALRGRSVSAVKVDVRILFAVLNVSERDRHVMGRAALRVVERAASGALRVPQLRSPVPEVNLVKKRRPPRRRRSDGSASAPAAYL
jgi:DNA-binding CsgD family transcriptional regulator